MAVINYTNNYKNNSSSRNRFNLNSVMGTCANSRIFPGVLGIYLFLVRSLFSFNRILNVLNEPAKNFSHSACLSIGPGCCPIALVTMISSNSYALVESRPIRPVALGISPPNTLVDPIEPRTTQDTATPRAIPFQVSLPFRFLKTAIQA